MLMDRMFSIVQNVLYPFKGKCTRLCNTCLANTINITRLGVKQVNLTCVLFSSAFTGGKSMINFGQHVTDGVSVATPNIWRSSGNFEIYFLKFTFPDACTSMASGLSVSVNKRHNKY